MQYYTLSGQMGLIADGVVAFLSAEEVENLERIAKDYDKNEKSTITKYDLAMTYPEAQGYLKKKLKELTAKLREVTSGDNKMTYQKWVQEHVKTNHDREIIEWLLLELYISVPARELEAEIKQTENLLYLMSAKEKLGQGSDLALNIQTAKQVPITNYIKFNQAGFAKCPFHGTDKTPSLKYYPKENRWHCFGACGEGGDVIDLVGRLFNVQFLDAVKIILGK